MSMDTNKVMDANKPSRIDKGIEISIYILGLLMVLFHMFNAKVYIVSSVQFINAHLFFSYTIAALTAGQKTKKTWMKYLCIGIALIVTFCTVFIHFNYEVIQYHSWNNTKLELAIGLAIVVIAVVLVRICIGWFMAVLISAITIYPFFGQYLPEPLTTKAYAIQQSIANWCISLNSGIYGSNIRTSAEYIFLFVVFGALLSATGVQKFFWELGKILFRKMKSGPGMMTVLNCGLVGMVTGSALANVMITGVFTIPAMKKAGYSGVQAGALSASAATGGQIMPPVMGVMAFIMAGYTGIPYRKIIVMAIIPALLYYLGLGLYAHFVTVKQNKLYPHRQLTGFADEAVDWRIFWWKMPGFVIPLGVIIVLLANDVMVMTAAFWSILAIIALSFCTPKDMRPRVKDLLNGVVSGAREGANLAVTIIAAGLITITFSGSGLAVKLASGINTFSGGTLLGVLIIVWIICILFGMIGVSVLAYYMSASFASAIMMKNGLSLEATHFFIMFPCVFSVITPPVALASLVSSRLSESNYVTTAIETCKAAFTGFFLPFLCVYAPAVIMMGNPAEIFFWLEIIICVIFVASGEFFFIGYMLTSMTLIERILLGAAYLSSIAFLFVHSPLSPGTSTSFLWMAILAAMIAMFLASHLIRYRSERRENAANIY